MRVPLFAVLCLSHFAVAQPTTSADVRYEDLPPLSTVVTKLEQTQDLSDLNYLCIRCTSLFTAMSSYFSAGPGAAVEAEKFFEAAETMLDASQRTATAGLALDSAEAEKARAAVLQMIPMLVSSLIERMNSNTLSSGAGFRDDELIQSDLRTCRNALTALSES
jgi:hypothetical protein